MFVIPNHPFLGGAGGAAAMLLVGVLFEQLYVDPLEEEKKENKRLDKLLEKLQGVTEDQSKEIRRLDSQYQDSRLLLETVNAQREESQALRGVVEILRDQRDSPKVQAAEQRAADAEAKVAKLEARAREEDSKRAHREAARLLFDPSGFEAYYQQQGIRNRGFAPWMNQPIETPVEQLWDNQLPHSVAQTADYEVGTLLELLRDDAPSVRLERLRQWFKELAEKVEAKNDLAAKRQLPAVQKEFIAASRAYWASSAPYQADRQLVRDFLGRLRQSGSNTAGLPSENEEIE